MRGTWSLKKMPLGIGKLKSLQTLSQIIIGDDNNFGISELKNLQNLHGKVSIQGLGNVQNAVDAREANLPQKRLSELELDWGNVSNIFRTAAREKEVLNELKPHNGTLKELKIVSYGGTEFPNWVGDLSFLQLTKVSIDGCEECTSLPRLGQLPSLKELLVGRMSKVKVVGWELLGTGLLFPSLEILRFEDMSGWEVWSTNSGVVDAAFPCLRELSIEDCPNLVKVSLEALPSLRFLKLKRCGHGVLKSLVDVASSVTTLNIRNISGLTDEQWRGVIQYLGEVEEVTINGCNEIRYLWESDVEASKVLVKLGELGVRGVSNMVSLGEKEEDYCGSNLTSLRSLSIILCNSLEHCRCPDDIEVLSILSCDSIKSVSFPTGGQKLKSLQVMFCKKLLKKEFGGEMTDVLINSSMRMLEYVVIYTLPNLKLINGLSCFIHLKELKIIECLGMESFPDQELPNLTSLKYLYIQRCTSMDASFPRGFWPPKLSMLEIGGLKKPISEWGPQNFPTSLVSLTLWGEPCDDVRNFGELSHLFPSSLTSLSIHNFRKAESVSMGLQHLTSLQHFLIFNCPKLIDLPEMLLPSLLRLGINDSPNLKERISRGGSYWPLVSLLPSFWIDGELPN